MQQRNEHPGFRMMSEAVQAWYRFYEVRPDDRCSNVLCQAAIDLYQGGLRTVDDIATTLIGSYVGVYATRVNAPTSLSVH
jgi:hypothetical protein